MTNRSVYATLYCGGECTPAVGDIVFLVDCAGKLFAQYEAPRANMSGKTLEEGWLGATNNISRTSRGRHRITHVLDWSENDSMSRGVRVVPA